MGNYSRYESVKKSIYEYVTDKINTTTNYTVSNTTTGLSYIAFYPEYPVNIAFSLPSLSIDVESKITPVAQDLGTTRIYPFNCAIDIFAKRNKEQDYLLGKITEALENKEFYYWDYDGASTTRSGRIKIARITSEPLGHLPFPTGEEEYRGRILFLAELYQSE